MSAGKTEGRAFRTEVVPDGVGVNRGINGAHIEAEIQFTKGGPVVNGDNPVPLSVSFPPGQNLACPCC